MTPVRDVRALVVGADPVLLGLFEEWLEARGCRAVAEDGSRGERFDIIVVDLPFQRHEGLEQLKSVAARHPGTPILALSSSLLSGVAASGPVAKALGVARVLPKPVTQEALLSAVASVLAQ